MSLGKRLDSLEERLEKKLKELWENKKCRKILLVIIALLSYYYLYPKYTITSSGGRVFKINRMTGKVWIVGSGEEHLISGKSWIQKVGEASWEAWEGWKNVVWRLRKELVEYTEQRKLAGIREEILTLRKDGKTPVEIARYVLAKKERMGIKSSITKQEIEALRESGFSSKEVVDYIKHVIAIKRD